MNTVKYFRNNKINSDDDFNKMRTHFYRMGIKTNYDDDRVLFK